MKNHFSTDAGLKRIRPPKEGRVTWRDANSVGLTVDVSHKGSMTWYGLLRDHHGKTSRQKLGNYLPGSHDGLGLAEARGLIDNARQRARAGLPPWQDLISERNRTFGKVRDLFIAKYVERNCKPNTQKAYKSVLYSDTLNNWVDLKITDISRRDVLDVLDSYADRGKLTQANRVLAYLRKAFNWMADQDIIKEGYALPTDRVKAPLKVEKPRDRVLSPDEVKLVWDATEKLSFPFQQVIRLMLVTGQRKQEVASMRASDVDLKSRIWTQHDNKAGRTHIVPLNDLAVEVIKSAPVKPIRNKSMLFTTTGSTAPSGFSKAKRQLDQAIKNIIGDNGEAMEHWVLHDLRRTVTTHMRRLGVSRLVCSQILNHAQTGVTATVYDHHDGLDEKTHALKVWSDYLVTLFKGRPDNVVQLNDRK